MRITSKSAGSRDAGSPGARHQSGHSLGRARNAATVNASHPSTPPGVTDRAASVKTVRSQKPVHSTSA